MGLEGMCVRIYPGRGREEQNGLLLLVGFGNTKVFLRQSFQ